MKQYVIAYKLEVEATVTVSAESYEAALEEVRAMDAPTLLERSGPSWSCEVDTWPSNEAAKAEALGA